MTHAPQRRARPRQQEHDAFAPEHGRQLRERPLRLRRRRAQKRAERAELAESCPHGCPRRGAHEHRDRRATEPAHDVISCCAPGECLLSIPASEGDLKSKRQRQEQPDGDRDEHKREVADQRRHARAGQDAPEADGGRSSLRGDKREEEDGRRERRRRCKKRRERAGVHRPRCHRRDARREAARRAHGGARQPCCGRQRRPQRAHPRARRLRALHHAQRVSASALRCCGASDGEFCEVTAHAYQVLVPLVAARVARNPAQPAPRLGCRRWRRALAPPR